MLIWFVALAPILVAEVFRSPMIDYRVVMVSAVLPLVEALAGGPYVLHTLAAPVVSLTVVMLATQGRRLLRRRLLGVPIGLAVHLVLDGSWDRAQLFWWPVFGLGFGDGGVPEVDRPIAVIVFLELVGVVAGAWAWKRYELSDPEHWDRLKRTGQLDRSVLS